MFSKSSSLHVRQQHIPVFFKGDSFEFWSIKMKTLFKSEGLWDFVEIDSAKARQTDDEVRQKDYQKQDAKALFFIQQAVDKSIFCKIATATSAKQAWSLLKTEYQESNKELKLDILEEDTVVDVDITVQSLVECLKKGQNQTKESSPSIYMVPSTLKDHNPRSFKPRIVSIGPLHREDENLRGNEGEKATHVLSLLSRLGSTQEEPLKACARKVNDSIEKIRSCYADTIFDNDNELSKIMVMDACFILEFLYRNKKDDNPNLEEEVEKPNLEKKVEKPNMENIMFVQFTMYDLLLLENQIPFFVLEDIFECTISKFDQTVSLIKLIHTVLQHVNPFKQHKLKTPFISNTTHHHILSLLHECYQYNRDNSPGFLNSRFPSAVELDRAGVNFKRARDTTEWALSMEVKTRRLPCFSFSWGKPTLIMPELEINDFTELVLRNLIAYEQLSGVVNQYITSYVMAMDMLIDTQEDIAKLVESKVLVNHIGSNQEAADIINNICKEVAYRDFFYSEQWKELDRHCNGYWSKNIAWLRRTYFNNPWNFIALLAGMALFALTVVQTFFPVNPA